MCVHSYVNQSYMYVCLCKCVYICIHIAMYGLSKFGRA